MKKFIYKHSFIYWPLLIVLYAFLIVAKVASVILRIFLFSVNVLTVRTIFKIK